MLLYFTIRKSNFVFSPRRLVLNLMKSADHTVKFVKMFLNVISVVSVVKCYKRVSLFFCCKGNSKRFCLAFTDQIEPNVPCPRGCRGAESRTLPARRSESRCRSCRRGGTLHPRTATPWSPGQNPRKYLRLIIDTMLAIWLHSVAWPVLWIVHSSMRFRC